LPHTTPLLLGLVDLVLWLTLAELLGLWVFHRLTGRGLRPSDYAWNMLSGLCLMLALRSTLHAAPWVWTAISLLAAGLIHALDLWSRWRAQRTPPHQESIKPS
jgi:hypothetical protein